MLILGAGFSHAINPCMPLTNDLGNRMLADPELRDHQRTPESFTQDAPFETWLSLLAEDQPYLATGDNIESRGLFERALRALTFLLRTDEMKAIAGDAPAWFYELLSALHFTNATVVTFNYDTLVEVGVASHRLIAPDGKEVTARDVLWDVPPLPRAAESTWGDMDRTLRESFRLLKLHGSLDWWWVPGDASGATLSRAKADSTFGDLRDLSGRDQFRQFGARERFIVPPLALKSSFYGNPVARAFWLAAADALLCADRVALVGYSLPATDIVVNGMLGHALRDGASSVVVVNPDPGDLPERLVHLGVDPDSLQVVDSVESYARGLCGLASQDVATSLRQLPPGQGHDTKLLVTWGDHGSVKSHAVGKLLPVDDGRTVELRLDEDPPDGPTAVRHGPDGSPVCRELPCVSDLARAAHDAERIMVRTGDGRSAPIVGSWYERRETGESAKWLVLAPAGREPG